MPEKKKTVLVVGGAGFIGSHVNKLLHENGYYTIVFDNLSKGNTQAVTRGTFFEGDLANKKDLEKAFSESPIDAVMHFAAYIDVGESINDPAKYYKNNVANTLNLLETMLSYHVKTFIFSSSAAIFGIPNEKSTKENFISESDPCSPINPYGESKLMVEKILRDYDKAYGLKSCSLRYFNAAGGDPDKEVKNYKKNESNLIPIVLKSLKNQTEVIINGTDYSTPDGTCVRDYIHVFDLGDAHIAAMQHLLNGKPSTSYNLGNGRGFSVRQVIKAAEKVTGLSAKVKEGPRREGDPPYLVSNSEKAENELGWHPRFSTLEEMIKHAWINML